MCLENNQQLHHTFFELYIYQDSIQLKKDLQKQLCQKHFLSFISIRNRIKYKKKHINCFITHFLIHKAFRKQILL